jgi:hypothetical protein
VYYSSDEKDWKTYDTRITVDYYEFRHMSLVEKLNMYRSESVWVNVRIPFARNYPKEAVELLQKGVAVRGVAKGELKKDGYIWRLEVELMLSRIGGILVDKMWDK